MRCWSEGMGYHALSRTGGSWGEESPLGQTLVLPGVPLAVGTVSVTASSFPVAPRPAAVEGHKERQRAWCSDFGTDTSLTLSAP